MERGDGSTPKIQRSLEMYPSPCSRLHDNIGTPHSQGERRDRDQVRQSSWNYPMFPRSNLQGDIARGSLTAKDVWKTLKDQLEGQESHTKIYLLTLLYTTKQEEGSLDVYGYVKSIEAIWRRLNDVNLELPEEIVVLMTLMGLLPSFGSQIRLLESRKDLSMDIIKKDLRQEALRLKAEQAQQPQGALAINLTREDSRRRKREKV